MYNQRLTVVSGLSVSQFDVDAYNEGMDKEDRLRPDDYEHIGEIIGFYTDDFVSDFKYRADEADGADIGLKRRIGGFRIETSVNAVEDNDCRHYYDRNFGGRQLAEISAETLFFGHQIRMTMAVIMRHGYYDGVNLDQQIDLTTDFSAYGILDDYTPDDIGGAADCLIEEYDGYGIASRALTAHYRKGIVKRLGALEKALWQRYEKLVEPYCEEYLLVVRASNGEAFYEKKPT